MKFVYAGGARPLDGYTLKRGIGRGGFGEVYFAVSDAGKEVALKKVERNLDVELRGVGHCLNLRHTNLVELYDVKYDEAGEPWIVMEYVAGSSLKDILDGSPTGLPQDEILSWFRGISAGVAYLHDHGIVHRDLKPGNVFDDNGCVKIGDYGLSKYIACSRRSGHTESVGTCHYMAPEIGKGDYGKEIDIYALGVVLFELFTGRVPFDGESSQEVLMKHLTADPDLSPLPPAIRTIVAKALRKDPADRYKNIDAMLADVEAAMAPATSVPVITVGESLVLPPEFFSGPVPTHSPVASLQPETPPLVQAPATVVNTAPPHYIGDASQGQETLYIGDQPEIEFGPVKAGPGRPLAASAPGVTRNAISPPRRNAHSQPARPASRPEPVAAAVTAGAKRASNWLQHGPGGTVVKSCIVLGAVVALIGAVMFVPFAAPSLAVATAVYLVYIGVRGLTIAAQQPPEVTFPAPAGRQGFTRAQTSRLALGMKTPWDRVGELSGSLLAATLVSAVLSLVITSFTGRLATDPISLAFLVWLTLSGTIAAWFILAAGKLWEADDGEPWKRRFVLLLLGLVCGGAAYGLNQVLLVQLHDQWLVGSLAGGLLPSGLHASDGSPLLAAYLIYFAAVFCVLPWWKQTDPLRDSRLSVGFVVIAALAALIFPFPQPWGLAIAATASIAAQLSAVWLSPRLREDIHQKIVRGADRS